MQIHLHPAGKQMSSVTSQNMHNPQLHPHGQRCIVHCEPAAQAVEELNIMQWRRALGPLQDRTNRGDKYF
jgi:hypothetical protein